MAQDKNDKELNAAINELLKDYKNAMKNAVKFASNEALKDIELKSKICLQEYYDNYPNPSSYDRTYSLQYAFAPYLKIDEHDSSNEVFVGVEYEISALQSYIESENIYWSSNKWSNGVYKSSKRAPIKDASWVLDNYLAGVHPDVNGGTTSREGVLGHQDSESPDQKMYNYLNSYGKIFDKNVLLSFVAQIKR